MDESAVRKAARQGRILLVDGKVDPRAADAAWSASSHPGNHGGKRTRTRLTRRPKDAPAAPENGQAPPSGAVMYASSRASREAALAQMAHLDLEVRRGVLIDAGEARAAMFKLARRTRDMLLALPERLAPRFAAGLTSADCHRILREEVERVCNEIASAHPL